MKIWLLLTFTIFSLVSPAFPQTTDSFVAIFPHGLYGNDTALAFYAVTGSGDIVSQGEDMRWRLERNIFDEAGYANAGDKIVALAHQTPTSELQCSVTASGEYFFQSFAHGSRWTHEGNIGTLAGHPATGQFVALTVNGSYMYAPADGRQHALTDHGEWYRKPRNAEWMYVGNIADDSSVVLTPSRSVGKLKASMASKSVTKGR